MSIKKITIDKMTEAEMERVRQYLANSPNSPHNGKNGEFCGNYVALSGDANVCLDKWTGETKSFGYENVSFELVSSGAQCEYNARRESERKFVFKGLLSLLSDLVDAQE